VAGRFIFRGRLIAKGQILDACRNGSARRWLKVLDSEMQNWCALPYAHDDGTKGCSEQRGHDGDNVLGRASRPHLTIVENQLSPRRHQHAQCRLDESCEHGLAAARSSSWAEVELTPRSMPLSVTSYDT
jgi:hypothetical protein